MSNSAKLTLFCTQLYWKLWERNRVVSSTRSSRVTLRQSSPQVLQDFSPCVNRSWLPRPCFQCYGNSIPMYTSYSTLQLWSNPEFKLMHFFQLSTCVQQILDWVIWDGLNFVLTWLAPYHIITATNYLILLMMIPEISQGLFNNLYPMPKQSNFSHNNLQALQATDVTENPPHPFLLPFLLPSWRAVRSYRPHLEERDPIWGDD